jgi:hypothetical protein
MAEMFGANMPTPNPSIYGGSALEAPRQDTSTQMLVGGIGSMALEAYAGKSRADLKYDLESLEVQTQAANDTIIKGGGADAALSKFSDKIKNLDAGIFSGSLTPAEYKIKRELLLKEHTKNLPGLAADFQNIYSTTGEQKTVEQFSLRQQMEQAAQKERERQDAVEKMKLQWAEKQGANMARLLSGSPEQQQAEWAYADKMNMLSAQAKEASTVANLSKDIKVSLGQAKLDEYTRAIIPTVQRDATNNALNLLKQYHPTGILSDGDPNVALINFAAEAGQRLQPAQRDVLKKQLTAMRDTTKTQLGTQMIGLEMNPNDQKLILDSVNRYDQILNVLDNADYAKIAEAQVRIEKSMDILNLRKDNPSLATSVTLLEEYGKNMPTLFSQDLTTDMRGYLADNKKRAGTAVVAPVPGVNPYDTISKDIDPKGHAGVTANNIGILNQMVSAGTPTPQARVNLGKAAQAYMQLPDDPANLNLKDVEAYLTLINNPKLPAIMSDHPTFKDKVLGNVDYILKNKLTPFIKEQASSLITENTRLVQSADTIIFEGDNAAKLNKLGGLLNNTVLSVSKMGTPNQEALRGMQKVMKQEVQTILDEVRKPATTQGKETTSWFSNFLNSINPTAEISLGDVVGGAVRGSVGVAKAIGRGMERATSPEVTDFVDAATATTIYATKSENVAKELMYRSAEFANWWHNAAKEQRDSFVERSRKGAK